MVPFPPLDERLWALALWRGNKNVGWNICREILGGEVIMDTNSGLGHSLLDACDTYASDQLVSAVDMPLHRFSGLGA